ncbi:mucin-2-like [Liolophura sinensis]|uniref:mucin-2-like n=1 Tax=Liolophura sinensis TaxID=3198878 RepID=UPI003158068C
MAPAAPSGVEILSITTNSVEVKVTLSAGRYDGLRVQLYGGQGSTPVSSWIKNVTAETVNNGDQKTITVSGFSPSLTPGVQYSVKVSTRSGSKFSVFIGQSSPETVAPAAPSGVEILSITTNSVEVKVTLSAGRYDGLRVQLYGGQGSTPVSSWIKNVTAETVNNGDQKTITVSGFSPSLTPGVQYSVKVSTRSGSKFSVFSGQSSPETVAPATPSGVEIQSITTISVQVKVTLSAGRYDGLRVQLYTGQGSTPVSSGIKGVTAETVHNGTEKTITVTGLSPSLTPGVQYSVKVSTRSGSKFSAFSGQSSPDTVAPATPSGVEIQSITTISVQVKVTLSAGRYDGLRVQLYTGQGSTPVSSGIKGVTAETVHNGTEKTITVTGLSPSLTPGVQYSVKVSTRSGSKFSAFSGQSSPDTVAPAAPSGVEILSITTNSVEVKVTLSAGRYDGLRVQLYGGQGSTPVSSWIKNVTAETVNNGDQKTITVSGFSPSLTPGVQYSVKVSTRSGSKFSVFSGQSSPETVAPATPSGVEIQSITTISVQVKVTLSAGRYDGLRVQLYTGQGSTPVSSGIKGVTAETVHNGTEKTITVTGLSPSLTPGVQYSVKVSTRSGSKFSAFSGQSSPDTVAPATPSGVEIQSITTISVQVKVTLSAGRYDGLRVQLYTGQGSTPVSSGIKGVTAETVHNGTEKTITVTGLSPSLTPGVQYSVKVSTRSGSKFSAFSGQSSPDTVAPAAPSGVEILFITTNSVEVKVTLSAGRYDGLRVQLYTGQGSTPVSSGIKGFTAETVHNRAEKTITVTGLSPSLTPGVQYSVKVSTRSGSKFSAFSGQSSPDTVAPATPSGVEILSITTNSVEVKVTLSAGRYDGLRVQLYRGQGSTPVSSGIKGVTAQTVNNGAIRTITVSALSSALTPGVQYTVKVSTRLGSKFSAFSGQSSPDTVAPATPSGVEILSITTNSVEVKVTLSAGRYDGLRVQLYGGQGSTPVSSGIKGVTAETVHNGAEKTITVPALSSALTPGAQYTVKVSTRSGSNFSGLSNRSNLKTVGEAIKHL